MCPWCTVWSEPRTVGVSPAHDASRRALENRVMSPISASSTMAVNSPTPGSVVSTFTRGSVFARACSCWSSRSMVGVIASMNARLSAMTCRDTAGSGNASSQARPGPVQ
jgi:hypothetical protein